MQSFQRIARRDESESLLQQCKEAKEQNRMGKTIDCFKKNLDLYREHFMQ